MNFMELNRIVEQSSPVSYRVTSPAPRDTWYHIQALDKNSLVSQSPEWLDCLRVGNHSMDASRYYETAGGQQIILPMMRQKKLFGAISTASSFSNSWGMGGLISTQPLRDSDIQMVLQDISQMNDLSIRIRPNPLQGSLWESARAFGAIATPRLAHVLDLSGGFDFVFQNRFRSTTRTAIRKAEKNDVVVECDTSGRLLPVFYQLFEISLERWARKQHEPLFLARFRGHRRDPFAKFQIMAELLGTAFQIWVAWYKGKPAASIIVLMGNNAYYTRGAMDIEVAGPVRANDLLHRMAIEEACQMGCQYYHMGESGDSKSLSTFKQGFGAEPISYAEYTFEKLPMSRVDQALRGSVKRLIGFKDV
jgi:hypothetical protein